MADFNVDVGGAPRVPSPVSPVSDNSTAEGINSFGNLLTGVGSVIGSALVQGKQTEALQKQNHVLDQLHQNILRHADLVDQGVQNSDAAYRRIRVLAAQASASNPALRDQITKMVNGDLAAGGLANNLVTGTQAEQDKHALEMQQKKEALTANFLDPSADEATQAQQIQNFNQFKLGKAKMEALRDAQALENSRLEEQSKRLGIANSSVSLQRNRLGLQQKRAKIQYNQAIGQMALGELPNVTGKLDKIANDPNMTVDQKLEQTKLLRELYRGKLTGDALAAGADGVPASIAKSFDNIFQMREDMLTGKFQGDNAQAQLDSVIAQSQNAILTGDPKLLNIVALGTKIGAVDGTSRDLIAQKVADMVHAGTKLPGINGSAPSSQPPNLVHTNDDERKDVSQYTRIVKENVADVVANKTTNPQHRDEAQTQMNTALDSIYKNSPNAPNPQALQTVVNMFAAPAIGKYLANPAHGVDKELQDKAANAYRAYYVTKVIPLIKDEYENTYVQTGIKASSNPKTGIQAEYTPRGKVIAPVYNNGTISFQFVGDQSQNTSAVQEAVKDMNKKISPILNTMVRADAHLNSSTNYDQYANDILGSLFLKRTLMNREVNDEYRR